MSNPAHDRRRLLIFLGCADYERESAWARRRSEGAPNRNQPAAPTTGITMTRADHQNFDAARSCGVRKIDTNAEMAKRR
jgi:hypothetical protein